MGRWLWLLISSLLLLGALSSIDPARAPDASSLGGTCESTRDCVEGTRCIHTEGAMDGQCSSGCSATQGCQEEFGQASLCLGADVCARTCAQATDCPDQTVCNMYGWCERAASE
jgi:hypothetical protein